MNPRWQQSSNIEVNTPAEQPTNWLTQPPPPPVCNEESRKVTMKSRPREVPRVICSRYKKNTRERMAVGSRDWSLSISSTERWMNGPDRAWTDLLLGQFFSPTWTRSILNVVSFTETSTRMKIFGDDHCSVLWKKKRRDGLNFERMWINYRKGVFKYYSKKITDWFRSMSR